MTAHRAAFRRTLTWLIVLGAVVAAVGYLLPAHRVFDEDRVHSNYADGGIVPLLIWALVAVIAVTCRKFRLGSGMATGAVAAGGAIAALMPVVLVHFLSRTEEHYGEMVFALGELTLLGIGATLFVVEPILYVLERRRIERDARPPGLPVATLRAR